MHVCLVQLFNGPFLSLIVDLIGRRAGWSLEGTSENRRKNEGIDAHSTRLMNLIIKFHACFSTYVFYFSFFAAFVSIESDQIENG